MSSTSCGAVSFSEMLVNPLMSEKNSVMSRSSPPSLSWSGFWRIFARIAGETYLSNASLMARVVLRSVR